MDLGRYAGTYGGYIGKGIEVGMVMTITRRWTVLGKLKHYLFECPTFWRIKPAFQCPNCGERYRCYWDGHDIVSVLSQPLVSESRRDTHPIAPTPRCTE